MVMNGDIVSQVDMSKFYDFACGNKAKLNVTVKKNYYPYEFGNIFFDGDRVKKIGRKGGYYNICVGRDICDESANFELIPKMSTSAWISSF